MGQQLQQPNAPTQVYYDPAQQQYFSYKPSPATSSNVINTMFGLNTADQERMYLNNPFVTQDRFKTNAQATPYAELTNLFPSLNASSMQGLISSPDGAMSGAGRFLSPQTNNTQGK
jgi:hypothetical protein